MRPMYTMETELAEIVRTVGDYIEGLSNVPSNVKDAMARMRELVSEDEDRVSSLVYTLDKIGYLVNDG